MITPDDPLFIRLRQQRNARRVRSCTPIAIGFLLGAGLINLWRTWQ